VACAKRRNYYASDAPKTDPTIRTEKERIAVGETLRVNCISGRSRPASAVTWKLNGDRVSISSRHPVSCTLRARVRTCVGTCPRNFRGYVTPLGRALADPPTSVLFSRPVHPVCLVSRALHLAIWACWHPGMLRDSREGVREWREIRFVSSWEFFGTAISGRPMAVLEVANYDLPIATCIKNSININKSAPRGYMVARARVFRGRSS